MSVEGSTGGNVDALALVASGAPASVVVATGEGPASWVVLAGGAAIDAGASLAALDDSGEDFVLALGDADASPADVALEGCGGGALALQAMPAMVPVRKRNSARSIFMGGSRP